MKPKAIWLISGGPMQAIAAQEIRRRGFELIVSDRDPNAVCARLAHHFIPLDTFDILGHKAEAERLREFLDIRAVLTVAADCHVTVAHIAHHLGLHGLSPTIAESCRDKSATRAILTKAGLRQPQFHSISSFEEAEFIVASHPDQSWVLKATDNSGSRGFSALPAGQHPTPAQFQAALENGTTGRVIIEEMLTPRPDGISELSVETVWENGKMYWINWVDRIFPRDLRFFPGITLTHAVGDAVEIGHINPAHHPEHVQQSVSDAILAAGCALGFSTEKGAHILKADIFLTIEGPVILEVTPRISGGWDSSASSPARGADIVGGVIDLALGKPLMPETFEHRFQFKDSNKVAVVLTTIPDNAENCIGRQFTLASGNKPIEILIQQALDQLEKQSYIVPNTVPNNASLICH